VDDKQAKSQKIDERAPEGELNGLSEEEIANLDIEVREIQRSVRPRGVLAE